MSSVHVRRTVVRRTLVLIGAAVLTVPFAAGNAFAAPSGGRHTIAGSSPSWAHGADVLGSPASSTKISFNVVLPLRDAATAEKLATDVANPKSTNYGHYLTAAQFNARFAPTASQVATVRAYLTGAGLSVTGVADGNRWISATGTVKQVESAFATTLRNYRYKGRTVRAPATSLSVPTSVGALITGVVGVATDGSLRTPDIASAATGSGVDSGTSPGDALPPASACSQYWDQHEQVGPAAYGKTSFPTPNCGYTPKQLRGAYDVQSAVNSGDTGRGVTVAIVDAYANPTMLADSDALSAAEGEPQLTASQYTETTFTPFNLQDECGGELGWNEEEALDVEAVHALAPGAKIHYFGAQNCDTGIDDAVNYIIQHHSADLVSNSYGFLGEDGLGDEVATEHSMFVQAAAEGIGFYFSSGDDGDNVEAGTPHPEPDYPASDPIVTGVGGTSLAVTSKNKYDFETSWGDFIDPVDTTTSPNSYAEPLPGELFAGGGGGVSALFTEPAYQKLAVPSKLAKLNGKTAMRVVPDVATVGDPETGFLIQIQGQQVVIGGTSLACPVFAGIQALASQGRFFPIGFANPLLYTLGLTGLTFHDVKAPSKTQALMTTSGRTLVTLGDDTSLTSTKGYDDTTGLGTPVGTWLLLGEHLLP